MTKEMDPFHDLPRTIYMSLPKRYDTIFAQMIYYFNGVLPVIIKHTVDSIVLMGTTSHDFFCKLRKIVYSWVFDFISFIQNLYSCISCI